MSEKEEDVVIPRLQAISLPWCTWSVAGTVWMCQGRTQGAVAKKDHDGVQLQSALGSRKVTLR